MQHGGLQECQPPAVENDSTSSLLSFNAEIPRSVLWLPAGQAGKLKSLLCWCWTSFRDLYGFVTYWDKRCTRLDSSFKRMRLDVQLPDDGVLCRLLQGNKRTWCDFQWKSRKRIPTFQLRNFSSRWFAMLQAGWTFTTSTDLIGDLWVKSFHTTIKHVTLKKCFTDNLW